MLLIESNFLCALYVLNQLIGPVQTRYFTWAESNASEGEQRIFLICIRFGSCEVRRLNFALSSLTWFLNENFYSFF